MCGSFRKAVPFTPPSLKNIYYKDTGKRSNDYFTYGLFLSHGS